MQSSYWQPGLRLSHC